MIDFTGWQYYKDPFNNENIGIKIIKSDIQESRLLQDPEVAKWLESGGTPLPAENN